MPDKYTDKSDGAEHGLDLVQVGGGFESLGVQKGAKEDAAIEEDVQNAYMCNEEPRKALDSLTLMTGSGACCQKCGEVLSSRMYAGRAGRVKA